jgi:hypothetical protein
MNLDLPDVAVAMAESAASAFDRAGGIELARRAESDPTLRAGAVAEILAELGVDDIDPCAGLEESAVAAELCRVAGRVALPYPVEMRLLASDRTGGAWVALRPGSGLVEHGDLSALVAVDVSGAARRAGSTGSVHGSRLGPFLVDVEVGDETAPLAPEARQALLLRASYVLGVCEHAAELATTHTVDRVQFDQPLADFQTVRFSLADAAVAVESLRMVLHYGVWRCSTAPDKSLADALAALVKAGDAAHDVLRRTQQLHGASAFPDENDISVLARHVQARLRVPYDADRSALLLAEAIETDGFDGLFQHGRTRG